ncbi:MAG: aldehyde dehydrogenase family protein [Cyanobacteria bacterium SZAS LIN-3]|nr:aldehyde dehydrogenase family protein [Cyanobacteria bacterium SZAS LIN-3]
MVVSKSTTLESINPATRAVLGRVPVSSEDDVRLAVERAWHAYEDWQLTSIKKRAKHIANLRKIIASRADEIAQLISEEVGKPLPESYFSELSGPLDTCLWLINSGEKLLADQAVTLTNPLLATKQSLITYEPLGVVGIISPWNYPFSIPMMTAIMALYAGNSVVIKPSEKSPLIGIKIGELFLEAGFPPGCVEIITGDRQTGEYLSKSRLGRLIFTGSVGGGQGIIAQSANSLTPVSLELGGKDAAIVLPDAPIEWTARGLTWGAFTNAGQACASVERVYIVKGKQTEELIKAIVSATQKLKVGPSSDPLSDMGPLIDQSQLDKVAAHVEDAVARGAKVLAGGRVREDLGGFFFEPTVLTDVTHDMKIMKEETFGPVLPIMVVDSEDQAVELANDSEFGLCATIWAGKLARAECVARDINVGTVLINDVLFSHAVPQLPWGGLKKSGFGRGHSVFGLHDLCNIKHISIDSASGAHRVWWYPYSKSRIKLAQGGIQLLHGGLGKRTSGLVDFVSNMFAKAEKKKQTEQSVAPEKKTDGEN